VLLFCLGNIFICAGFPCLLKIFSSDFTAKKVLENDVDAEKF